MGNVIQMNEFNNNGMEEDYTYKEIPELEYFDI